MKYERIKPYIEQGLVSEQSHPDKPSLKIFNYTQKCQFAGAWDEVTMHCRGLIIDTETDTVIARPFPKFFNYQEHVSKNFPIPKEHPQILEKLDGSLGIMYTLNGKTHIATRGSFTSEQALWATQWWRENKGDEPYGNETTHLFEIIYPQNRIVVNYDFSGLVHLASLNTETGKPLDEIMPVRRAQRFDNLTVEELLTMDTPNSEGFVLYYPESNIRMKVKFPEYVRLHKLITGVSEIAIWEHLRDGKDFKDLIEKVPDEFFVWVKKTTERLVDEFDKIADNAEKVLEKIKDLPTRKEQALAIKEAKPLCEGAVFALLDKQGARAAGMIWKMVRPHGVRAFKNDIDS